MNTANINNLNSDCLNDLQDLTADCAGTVAGLSSSATVLSVNWGSDSEWAPWSGNKACPKCGGHAIEVNNFLVLTSNPPQSQLRCKDCGYQFGSGIFSRNTNEDALDNYWQHDQSILGIPKVGDWPPGPQVGDAPWWPSEQEPPSYPDITIPSKDSPVGWICPKCGRCYAPHISGCSHCNSSYIKITY